MDVGLRPRRPALPPIDVSWDTERSDSRRARTAAAVAAMLIGRAGSPCRPSLASVPAPRIGIAVEPYMAAVRAANGSGLFAWRRNRAAVLSLTGLGDSACARRPLPARGVSWGLTIRLPPDELPLRRAPSPGWAVPPRRLRAARAIASRRKASTDEPRLRASDAAGEPRRTCDEAPLLELRPVADVLEQLELRLDRGVTTGPALGV